MTKKNNEGSVRNIAEAQLIPGSSAGHDDGVTGKDRRLSFVSRQYDIDGDGQLDEAEFAMRNLDKSGRGFLTNEKVYALMTEQLAMQSKIFQFKKIIIGLSAFIFVLALSNLATSFASAILAKDTASEGGLLVDKETRDAVATSQAMKMYAIGEGGSENERRLRKLQAGETNSPFSFFATVSVPDALAMLLDCYEGKEIVEVKYEEIPGQVVTKVICAPGRCATTSSFTMERDVPVAGELCTESDAKISFKPPTSGENLYTITLPATTTKYISKPGNGGGYILPPPPVTD